MYGGFHHGLQCEQPQGWVASPKERDPDPELHTGTGQKSQLRTRPATRPLKPAVLKSRRKGWGRSEIKVGDRRAATTGSRHLTLRASQLARIALAKMMPPTAAPATTAQHASVARCQQKIMVQLAPESGKRRCNNGALAQLTQGRLPAKSRALASIPDPCDRRRGSATDPLAKAGGRHSDRPRIIQHPGALPGRPHRSENTLWKEMIIRPELKDGMRMSVQQSTSSRWKEKLRSSSSSSSEAARKKLAEEKVWQRHIPCHLPCPPPSICTRIKH